jgi:hypothetical protein
LRRYRPERPIIADLAGALPIGEVRTPDEIVRHERAVAEIGQHLVLRERPTPLAADDHVPNRFQPSHIAPHATHHAKGISLHQARRA